MDILINNFQLNKSSKNNLEIVKLDEDLQSHIFFYNIYCFQLYNFYCSLYDFEFIDYNKDSKLFDKNKLIPYNKSIINEIIFKNILNNNKIITKKILNDIKFFKNDDKIFILYTAIDPIIYLSINNNAYEFSQYCNSNLNIIQFFKINNFHIKKVFNISGKLIYNQYNTILNTINIKENDVGYIPYTNVILDDINEYIIIHKKKK